MFTRVKTLKPIKKEASIVNSPTMPTPEMPLNKRDSKLESLLSIC